MLQRNDPEVQSRHRDVAERLRTNYSFKSKGSSAQLASSNTNEIWPNRSGLSLSSSIFSKGSDENRKSKLFFNIHS